MNRKKNLFKKWFFVGMAVLLITGCLEEDKKNDKKSKDNDPIAVCLIRPVERQYELVNQIVNAECSSNESDVSPAGDNPPTTIDNVTGNDIQIAQIQDNEEPGDQEGQEQLHDYQDGNNVCDTMSLTMEQSASVSQVHCVGSPITLTIDTELANKKHFSDIFKIYRDIEKIPQCRKTDGSSFDIVLGEACVKYHQYYLYPEYIPSSLDSYSNVYEFIAPIQAKDKYTRYIPPRTFQDDVLPSFEGDRALIGIGLVISNGGAVISENTPLVIDGIVPYSRAWIDGLKSGDQIWKVNGTSLEGLTLDEVMELLPRKEAESATLSIRRNGEDIDIHTASETHIAFMRDDGIAYFNVREYTRETGREVEKDFDDLFSSSGPIDKIILDVRQNGGGSVSGALELIDFLIDNDLPERTNPILIMDGTIDKNKGYFLGEQIGVSNISIDLDKTNMVVLADGRSASSTEITLAAIKHYGIATIIGTNSYGKGVSQQMIELIDGAGIIVTAHNMLAPDQSSYHNSGVSPDIIVAESVTSLDNDPQLNAAVEWLQTGSVSQERTIAPSTLRKGPQKQPWWLQPHLYR